ncbi:DUF2948 domain-containing protein [Rhodosalinus halophilus]|uniref:DUF2948 domain-containing protein n=1 Tax=Rhodosalinus halophilus TaxID=2259333 RepID=A0A365UD49_9RHOB|nr:DUF2948 family protein [Rhodosalinus halophilus]RBI87476.1 DUF2948 domain-containing protein [Rhodosalinus halophilus]
MTEDARFEDGRERPLNLAALDTEDLEVLSALLQDAVFPATEMRWDAKRRRFALLVNRFRWEDRAAAEARGRPYERTRAMLVVENVGRVSSLGIDRRDADTVLALLALDYEGPPEGPGALTLVLSGDGAIRLDVEALEARLKDVTRPYAAPSGKAPDHGV